MVRRIPSTDARRAFGELLDQVRSGDTIAITQNGRIVARLVPPEGRGAPMSLDDALAALHRLRPKSPLRRDEIRSLIDDGRRF